MASGPLGVNEDFAMVPYYIFTIMNQTSLFIHVLPLASATELIVLVLQVLQFLNILILVLILYLTNVYLHQ
jgi:hypothetical protein